MGEPLKKQRPSILRPSPDEEKTKDIPPPEKIREMLAKGQMNQAVGESVLELSKERLKLDEGIAQSKNKIEETKREDFESTRVFNLAQLKASSEMDDLAAKKKEVEKEISDLMKEKNAKMHDDLQKVTRFLVQETKRIRPLIETSVKNGKENSFTLEKGLGDLADLKKVITGQKAEMTTALTEVKSVVDSFLKNKEEFEALELKKKEIKKDIADLMIKLMPLSERYKMESESFEKLCSNKLKLENEYALLSQQKLETEQELSRLVISGKDQVVKLQEEKMQLEKDRLSMEESLSVYRSSLRDLAPRYEEKKDEFSKLQTEYQELENKKESVRNDILRLCLAKEELERAQKIFEALNKENEKLKVEVDKNKFQYDELRGKLLSLDDKKAELKHLDEDLELCLQDIAREEERLAGLAKDCREETYKLNKTKEELDRARRSLDESLHEKERLIKDIKALESEKAALKNANDVNEAKLAAFDLRVIEKEKNCQDLYFNLEQELILKKSEIDLSHKHLEEEFKNKALEAEMAFKEKCNQLDLKFISIEKEKTQEIKARLEEAEKGMADFAKRHQDQIAEAVCDVIYVKGQYALVKPDSAPSMESLKIEIKKSIAEHFKHTIAAHSKEELLKKITFYWAIAATSLLTLSLLLFYFKK